MLSDDFLSDLVVEVHQAHDGTAHASRDVIPLVRVDHVPEFFEFVLDLLLPLELGVLALHVLALP